MASKVVGLLICVFILVLDIVAGILGIKAEAAQNKEKHLRLWLFECKEPSHEAFVLGAAAIGLLVIAHVFANLVGGCSICRTDEIKHSSPGKKIAIAFLAFTWIIFAVAIGTLVIGAMANRKSRASCGMSHHNFLSIGGICCFVHAAFAVGYYVTATVSHP